MNNTPTRSHDSNPANRDAITGEPGSHPVGTGTGAAVGGVVGAAAGSLAGPVGTVLGAAAGAVAGGYAGKAAGEAANPTEQDAYWRANYSKRPYAKDFTSYDEAAPAYRYGWESASNPSHKGRSFKDVESSLSKDWDKVKGKSAATWDKAKNAVEDAWNHVIPGRNSH